jgi:hypothetical protein
MTNDNARGQELESQLKLLTEEFEKQMRARGFDPAQADNVALPSPLARLYGECQMIREELEEIQRDEQ